MKQGVIFDMDGVLIDSESYFFNDRIEFLKEQNLSVENQNILDYIGKTEQQIWETLLQSVPKNKINYRKKYEKYRQERPVDFKELVNPTVFDTLYRLKEEGYKVAICSSSSTKEIEQFLKSTDTSHLFDAIISSDDVTESKPSPEIYLKAIEALGEGNYIAVEDSTIGIQAATSAGLFTLALVQQFPVNQSKADNVIEQVSDLFEYLS